MSGIVRDRRPPMLTQSPRAATLPGPGGVSFAPNRGSRQQTKRQVIGSKKTRRGNGKTKETQLPCECGETIERGSWSPPSSSAHFCRLNPPLTFADTSLQALFTAVWNQELKNKTPHGFGRQGRPGP